MSDLPSRSPSSGTGPGAQPGASSNLPIPGPYRTLPYLTMTALTYPRPNQCCHLSKTTTVVCNLRPSSAMPYCHGNKSKSNKKCNFFLETSPNSTKSSINFLQVQQKVQIFSLIRLKDLHTLLYPRVPTEASRPAGEKF